MKLLRWGFVCFVLSIVFSTGVFADIRPPNTAETQVIATSTSVHCMGTFSESDSLVWQQSNEVLGKNIDFDLNMPIYVGEGQGDWKYNENTKELEHVEPGQGDYILPYPDYPLFEEVPVDEPEPPLAENEVQMTVSTRETTLADQGETDYMKRSTIDTNWKTGNMYNVDQEKMVGFSGSQTGRIISEESAAVDTVGMTMTTLEGEVWQCPLCGHTGHCLPPFCNVVEMGSSLDMKEVQFTTDIKSRSIAEIAVDQEPDIRITLPVVDGPPTELNYRIGVTGTSPDAPALGSVEAYVRAHAKEGSNQCATPCGGEGLDLVYNEKTRASGAVKVFQKDMHYTSGFRRAV